MMSISAAVQYASSYLPAEGILASLYTGSHADKDGREWYVPGLDFTLYGSPSSEGVGVAMRCGR